MPVCQSIMEIGPAKPNPKARTNTEPHNEFIAIGLESVKQLTLFFYFYCVSLETFRILNKLQKTYFNINLK